MDRAVLIPVTAELLCCVVDVLDIRVCKYVLANQSWSKPSDGLAYHPGKSRNMLLVASCYRNLIGHLELLGPYVYRLYVAARPYTGNEPVDSTVHPKQAKRPFKEG